MFHIPVHKQTDPAKKPAQYYPNKEQYLKDYIKNMIERWKKL